MVDTLRWSKLQTAGANHPARFHHTAVVFKDSIFIFGGNDGTRPLSDFFEFKISEFVSLHTLTFALQKTGSGCQLQLHPAHLLEMDIQLLYFKTLCTFVGATNSLLPPLHWTFLNLILVVSLMAFTDSKKIFESGLK
jgi:hypothetical protein